MEMKGLDLFLVLLILLSWRRCLRSHEAVMQQSRLATTLTSISVVVVAQSNADVKKGGDNDDKFSEGMQNISHTATATASTNVHFENLMKKLWSEFKFSEESDTNGVQSDGHYLYHAHDYDHDLDYDDINEDNFQSVATEGGHDESDEVLPKLVSQTTAESMKHRMLEHRRLQAFLRKHHYQHVKRHRLQLEEKEERLHQNQQHQHHFGRLNSGLGREEFHLEHNIHKNLTKALSHSDTSNEHSLSEAKKSHVHHYDHDSSWKSKKHEQHSKHRRGRHHDENHKVHHHSNNGDSTKVTSPEVALATFATTEEIDHDDKKIHIGRDKVFRHSNRFLDKFYMDTKQGYLDPDNLNSIDLNVSTISELIWKLRGMRSRRRRSFQALNLNQTKTGSASDVSSSSNSNTIDPRKLILSNVTWPLKRIAEIEGDIWLGALMMVHEREDNITCGPIMPQVCNTFTLES